MTVNFKYSRPKLTCPPAIPIAEHSFESVQAAGTLPEIVDRLDNNLSLANGKVINFSEGAVNIPDEATFDALAHRDDVPGALGVREVKFLVTRADTKNPKVYFLNTNNQKFHFLFARDVLDVPLSNSAFNAVTYFTTNRRFLAGTLIAHDSFRWPNNSLGLFALEFWPTDKVGVNFVNMAFRLVEAAMPFAEKRLAYHPSGAIQEDLYDAEKPIYEASGIQVVRTAEIFESVDYSPLNLGVGFGRMRVIDGASSQPPSIRDVVIFKSLPNDLSHVAGVLSEEPQTPLSHVNLRAKQNDTPNAYLRNASLDPRIQPLLDHIVRFEVKPDEIEIRAASAQEMEEHLDNRRPAVPQFPPSDLTQTDIVDLDSAGHSELDSIGAKAANVAELRKILTPGVVPWGFGVPFYFYDAFMRANGFYDHIRAMINDQEFLAQEAVREERLRDLRRLVRKAVVPTDLRDKLGAMHSRFSDGATPRCRSSTNNEDLVGFNGAGLYDSFTHREDEGHIEKSIKQVWASLWNFRAFEEREFYRIDHFSTAMGVLVHPNYDDEQVNGVALTKNIYFPGFEGFYVNAQVGEALVTNPNPNVVSEEFLVMEEANSASGKRWEVIRIRRSNLVEPEKTVMPEDRLNELISQMEILQAHFKNVYQAQNDPHFAMDIEFKITKEGKLAIKQARPWVD